MAGGFDSNDEITVFNGVTLTASYAGNTSSAYEFRSACGVTMLIKFTADAGSASAYGQVKVQLSADGTNWVDYGGLSGTGTIDFTPNVFKVTQATNGPTATVILDEVRARYIRFACQETGTTMSLFGTLSLWVYPHCK